MTSVNICAWCQKEFPDVDVAVRAAEPKGEVKFNHGICKRHYTDMAKQLGKSDEEIQKKTSTMANIPDLKEFPELVKQYSQGVFTPEEYKKDEFPPAETIKEMFQRRAGILHS